MTALDRNDRIPDDAPQNKVKLEWITPKISLMEGGDTDGSGKQFPDWTEYTTKEGAAGGLS